MTGSRWRLVAAAAIVAVLLACGGFLLGRFSAPSAQATPTTESAAAGFLRDMQTHHGQAVQMSLILRDRLSPDDPDFDEVRLLAYDIATGQGKQSGQMYGLLQAWGLSQASPRPEMAWLDQPVIDGSDGGGHDMDMGGDGTAAMPGMATAADLDDLAAASGVDEVRLYLTLMIAHHQGGVEMADAVLARTAQPEVVTLASAIVKAQTNEIGLMQDLLAALPAA